LIATGKNWQRLDNPVDRRFRHTLEQTFAAASKLLLAVEHCWKSSNSAPPPAWPDRTAIRRCGLTGGEAIFSKASRLLESCQRDQLNVIGRIAPR
jgi:hypothetical protein